MDFKDAILSVTVGKSATIENYKRILEYDTEHILVLGKNSKIHIKGQNLRIQSYSKEELQIKGNIKELSFEGLNTT